MVLIPKPMSEIPKNLKNWTVISGFLFWKVQILFKKKLDVAAMVNPIAFAMYFWILIIGGWQMNLICNRTETKEEKEVR